MNFYSVFDDLSKDAIRILENNGHHVVLNKSGTPRPEGNELKLLLEKYDGLIISTSTKLDESCFADIKSQKYILSVSIGLDHIKVPADKKTLVKVFNAPSSNRISVAEHVFGLIITLEKQFLNARQVSANGLNKTHLKNKPHDLYGRSIGVVGCGGIGQTIIQYANLFQMDISVFSNDSDAFKEEVSLKYGCRFVELNHLLSHSDIVVLCVPLLDSTKNIISKQKIDLLKDDTTFVSISRNECFDLNYLLEKCQKQKSFKVGLDCDIANINQSWAQLDNVIITPHIAGGTVESRQRMFVEVANNFAHKD